jgi:hypothetical protein
MRSSALINKPYFAFTLSFTAHLILALLLLKVTVARFESKPATTIKAIQSYLYKKPKALPKVVAITSKTLPKSHKTSENKKVKTKVIKSSTQKAALKPIHENEQHIQNKLDQLQKSSRSKNSLSFSALSQLKQLKANINDSIISEELSYQQRPRSLSVFSDLPAPVQHSQKKIGTIEKREKMTTNYSSNISITKGDNGNCTLKEDLTSVGMAGITALSGFKCGQTKMEKMYNAHMNVVLKKSGKNK